MKFEDFVIGCVRISKKHQESKVITTYNDICVKSGIIDFSHANEYKDEYLIISSTVNSKALYVESIKAPIKILVLIDENGEIIIVDNDYQYFAEYIRVLNSKIF